MTLVAALIAGGRALLARLTAPVRRALNAIDASIDPWERFRIRPPAWAIDRAQLATLARYAAGPSTVHVERPSDIETWLRGCAYERSHAFRLDTPDWATLPFVFEFTRRGDCLDHAVWAWRRFVELGADADLVLGWAGAPWEGSRHAWVLLRNGGEAWVLETAEKGSRPMARPLAEVRTAYLPEVGINRRGRSFAFGGCLRSLEAAKARSARVADPLDRTA